MTTNADQFELRIDHNFSPKDRFFARFTLDNITGPTTNPDQTAIDPAFGIQFIDRQRNVVGTYTRTVSPRLLLESSISITRSTPGFPTTDYTDPAVKFNDGLFEAFNSAAGSVMQAYGNLFQGQENVSLTKGKHAFKAGAEVRLNRDTTYFGISPDGEYNFGGGTAYSTEAIPSASGKHNIAVGDPLPDTLSSFLSGSPFVYTVAIAPPQLSDGQHIGPAAINRNNVNAYAEDAWRMTPNFTLSLGVRWELYTPISERAHRTSGLLNAGGTQEFVVDPQPGYRTDWHAFAPRCRPHGGRLGVSSCMRVLESPPFLPISGDNFLTGSTPFAVYPRLISAATVPIRYGFQITPAQIPNAYTPSGMNILASGNTKNIAPNTVMDLNRYEQDMAALTPGGVVSALGLGSVDRSFGNGTLFTWTTGLEKKFGNLTADASYVGTASEKLPRTSFPNAYSGASRGSRLIRNLTRMAM